MLAALTSKRSAAARCDRPWETAVSTRTRKSIDKAFDISAASIRRIPVNQTNADLNRQIDSIRSNAALADPLGAVPDTLSPFGLTLGEEGTRLVYEFDSAGERTGISSLLSALSQAGLRVKDISTEQSSLEDIFVELVGQGK